MSEHATPSMLVRVLFFSTLAEAVGTRESLLETRHGATVGSAMAELERWYPKLAAYRPSLMLALNETWCDGEATLNDGDVLAIMPPVSGG